MLIDNTVKQKASTIRLLAMDVDGVLTDGKIIYDSQGVESKEFFVQDGVGLNALKKFDIRLAIITGRQSPMVERRAKELGIDYVIQGRDDKATALKTLAESLNLPLDNCAYIGDDLPDVEAIKQAGLGLSVANGCELAKHSADYVTQKTGGNGAAREVCELILIAQNHYDAWLSEFMGN